MLAGGQAFEQEWQEEGQKTGKFEPGQTVIIGGREYVLDEDKKINIKYGAEIY